MAKSYHYLKEATSSSLEIDPAITDSVNSILTEVRDGGDEAIRALTEQFDDVYRASLAVSREEIDAAADQLNEESKHAIDNTIKNVRTFHEEQLTHIEGFETELHEGVTLGQRIVPIETVGTYVPGGRHPLVAAPAMSIIPAVVAGVDRIITCAPPQDNGTIQPEQLYAMDQAGADEIYCIGGAQAIGAMAYGSESVPSVDKVTGPGNVFTTEAKRQVYGHVGIDFLAGPSEVLILTDETADPKIVAIDLLAQAEHDPNARAILVSTSETIARKTIDELETQLPTLETEVTARESWTENGEVVVTEDMDTAIDLVNDYAIEHLQIMTNHPRDRLEDLQNYGSLFLGEYSPVVFGDKAVGTNHSLPTLEVARYSGGIWVGTYLKTLTQQQATKTGADPIARLAAKICELEGTHAHRLSAEARILE